MTFLRPPGPIAKGLRIGLLGGSFNPAHAGHRYVAETAIKRMKLDYVWFLVSPQNPLKPTKGMAPLQARLASARAIAKGDRRLIISDLEQTIESRYTNDTVRVLKSRFPDVDFFWLMGSDNLEQFHRWQHWQDILDHLPAIVVQRPGYVLAALKAKAIQAMGYRFTVLDGRRNELSATAIRARSSEAKAGVVD
ncbi:nicotinate-nucleotide adenylyltransferase [Rhizomicrobium palustre]|uniref:Probable nicotinate-nucleotide adenylyltransferase n=1 Tax=Rhizomicrobium palustre TaxID=189966 RepID=A0A846MYE3_9PROT|nr:nicotinate (nicotinamide) nucleotide adenylyltransferase [Rhizomicrobium palustre]NIK88638.1 nicotinate-nucleotide adenylyltransferase [Rhizomicrobium palustre]